MENAGMLHDREEFCVLFRIKVFAIMGTGADPGLGSTPARGTAPGLVAANHPNGAPLPPPAPRASSRQLPEQAAAGAARVLTGRSETGRTEAAGCTEAAGRGAAGRDGPVSAEPFLVPGS